MTQFDVFENPEQARQPNVPYLVVIQSDHFVAARTTVVVPLVRTASKKVTTAVNPEFEIDGERLTLEPVQVAFLPATRLKRRAGSIAGDRHVIVRAVDALMSGL